MEKAKTAPKEGGSPETAVDTATLTPKKFRQSPELEGFYRFIYENDLRKEALTIIDRILLARRAARLASRKNKVSVTAKAKN